MLFYGGNTLSTVKKKIQLLSPDKHKNYHHSQYLS